MEEKNLAQLQEFIAACNDFADGKFILADIKISKILKLISKTPQLYDLIAECMINYDFEKEYQNIKISQENPSFELPIEAHKVIPFVFCLLVEIDSKKINFNEFLSSQFPYANGQNEEFLAFSKNVIVPFRDAIANVFDIEIDQQEQESDNMQNDIIEQKLAERANELGEGTMNQNGENKTIIIQNITTLDPMAEAVLAAQIQEEEEVNLLFNRILRLARILDDKLLYVRNPLKKSNISLLLDALIEACEVKSVKIIVALVMAINNFAGNERSMREEIRELNTICYDFYEQ